MKLAVIVPFHEPKWLDNTQANLARVAAEHVVFSTNGAAIGVRVDAAGKWWPHVESGRSHASAVNAGAAWAKAAGFTHAACLDSDDWYGRDYLNEVRAALAGADYCGKRAIWTRLQNGELHLFARSQGLFMGGTLAFSLAAFVAMPETFQDDSDWCRAMASAGALAQDTGPGNYIYNRHGDNAHWRASDVQVRRAWGVSVRRDGQAFGVPTGAEVFADMRAQAAGRHGAQL